MEFFALGFVAGMVVLTGALFLALSIAEKIEGDEEFVIKLIKERGWEGARIELKFAFNGKHMRIWKRLRREHLRGKKDGNSED